MNQAWWRKRYFHQINEDTAIAPHIGCIGKEILSDSEHRLRLTGVSV